MAQNVVLGPDAKLDIIGEDLTTYPFRVVSSRGNDSADVNETTDTESAFSSKEHHGGGYTALTLDVEVQLDTEDNLPTVQMAIDPLYIYPQSVIVVQVWPEGRGVENSQYLGAFVVRSVSPGFMVRSSTPQGAPISLISTGYYKRPYENQLLDPMDNLPTFQDRSRSDD